MCRVISCFDVEAAEDTALATLTLLRANARDDVKVRIYCGVLFALDARLMDWDLLTRVFTGANHSDHVRRNRLFATEPQLRRDLRQWADKTNPDSLGHSEAIRQVRVAGMMTQVMSPHQRRALGKGHSVDQRFVLNDYGRAYLMYLEQQHHTEQCREISRLLSAERAQEMRDTRALMGGAR